MEKYRVTFVLGEAAVEALQDLDAGLPEDEIALQEITSSAIVTREFDSGSELQAYIQGIEDAQGCLSVEQLENFDDKTQERVRIILEGEESGFSPDL